MPWKGSNPQDAIPSAIEKMVKERVLSAAERVAPQMEDDAKRFTAERGRPNSDGPGRIASGRMIQAIKSRVVFLENQVSIGLGFLEDNQPYFSYQSITGFNHANAGYIEPTFALRDASANGQRRLIEELS